MVYFHDILQIYKYYICLWVYEKRVCEKCLNKYKISVIEHAVIKYFC